MDDYARAVQINPTESAPRIRLAHVLYLQSRFGEAIEHLKVVLQRDEDNVMCRLTLAWILATCPDDKHRDSSKALELAQSAYDASAPRNSAIVVVLAAAQASADNFDGATELIREAGALAAGEDQRRFVKAIHKMLRSQQQLRVNPVDALWPAG